MYILLTFFIIILYKVDNLIWINKYL